MQRMKINPIKFGRLVKYTQIVVLILVVLAMAGLFGLKHLQKQKTSQPTSVQTTSQIVQGYSDFHLLIPSLNIDAPIIADVDGSDKDGYFKALQNGVAHYKGTAKPGEGDNIFIFGHSSYYIWDPGKYKEIFRNLEDIKEGDEIKVWWQNKEYKYKVSQTKVVEPTETSVLQPTGTEQLTLMTCVPPGTAEKRLIVIAKPD